MVKWFYTNYMKEQNLPDKNSLISAIMTIMAAEAVQSVEPKLMKTA